MRPIDSPISRVLDGRIALQRLERQAVPLEGEEAASGDSFASVLEQALNDVNSVQVNARDTIQAFVRGEPVELHRVMAAAEEAGIALEMLVQVRNKLTEAYRTVMNMQS